MLMFMLIFLASSVIPVRQQYVFSIFAVFPFVFIVSIVHIEFWVTVGWSSNKSSQYLFYSVHEKAKTSIISGLVAADHNH